MKKILLPLTAVAAFAVIAAANIKIAAALAIMIVFFLRYLCNPSPTYGVSGSVRNQTLEKKTGRKRKKKRKNCQNLPRSAAGTFGLISFFPVEKPEILSSGFFVFKVNHRRDYRTCRFERTVLLYGQ